MARRRRGDPWVPGDARRPAAPTRRVGQQLPSRRPRAASDGHARAPARGGPVQAPDRGSGPASFGAAGGRRDGVASRAMAYVQTVLGPIEPSALGFTLPHEHTQIALWHIQGRWDYWQLTRDEAAILDELARYRRAGGGSLVDLTLPGVGRDPI